MALSFQTSTLSLTLPISCQICLGKVKKPVICANYHVFCSSCMEMWLKKASQCPTCRVPITTDNPCREIIGGTNESDHSDGPSMKKCLRKTRGELLLREYEDEIEGLVKENEELKTKNLSLESQLKIALDPASIDAVQTNDKKVDSRVLEEWANKLRVATECSEKVKQDMDKLKEANKALRSQNVDLLQENMRLKAEVASRSPQKFGRYTVAALEAKIQQYERDLDHLKRALERSDQYIEDLESRVREPESRCLEVQETHENSNAGTDAFTQQQKINMMLRSLSNSERGSICSNPEAEYRTFSRSHSFVFVPAANHRELNNEGHKKENLECASADFLPTTPSSAFRSLTLRSPGIREKKVAFKPASYLRRLDFEECPSPDKSSSPTENQLSCLDKFPKGFPSNTDTGPSKSVFWGGWQTTDSTEPGPSTESPVKGVSYTLVGDKTDSFQMSSEASMDAAYLDKISELDSMMLDGESSSSRGSQLSLTSSPPTGLDDTLVPEPQTCPDVLSSQLPCENIDDPLSSNEAPEASADESCFSLGPDRRSDAHVSDSMGHGGSAHTDEMSFDLLFDSVEENKVDPAGCLARGSPDGHYVNLSASSSCSGNPVNTAKERHALNISQRTKRKSHSPFNTSSPTKLSKLT